MARQTKVIHIAKSAADASLLAEKFSYTWVPLGYNFYLDDLDLKIFPNGVLASKLFDIIFIIDKFAVILRDAPELVKQIPAHRIIYSKEIMADQETRRVFKLKEALPMDLTDFSGVQCFINEHYLPKQEGYKLRNSYVKVNPLFRSQVQRKGNSYFDIKGPFREDYQQILTWKMTTMAPKNERISYYPEYELVSGELDVMFKVILIEEATGIIKETLTIDANQLAHESVTFSSQGTNSYISLSVYIKGGEGQVRIGAQHLRKAVRNGDVMIPGGHRIKDPEALNGELIHYFDPVDFKPPLAIYFSGYRSAEGFEGRRMMASMGCPYMLIGDPRLEGGNFYMGSEALEQQLVDVIKEKIELLGFTKDQVILSGLSMGTYGALYYAADLEPHCIIVGKPLVNIGDVAKNERINRPGAFGTSLDMLFHTVGEISENGVKKMNRRFWDKFLKGNYRDTTFALSYMKQDDYDMRAFPMLFKELKKKDPATRILYKGVVGRHNDNSPAVNNWFLKQYRNVMVNSFGRPPSTFK